MANESNGKRGRQADTRSVEELQVALAEANASLQASIDSQDFTAIKTTGHAAQVLETRIRGKQTTKRSDELKPMYDVAKSAIVRTVGEKAVSALVDAGVTRIELLFTSNGNAVNNSANPGVALDSPLMNVYTGNRGGVSVLDPETPSD